MSLTYQCWSDFGPTGVPPNAVNWEYDPYATYSLPEEDAAVIKNAWASLTEATDALHDAPGLNLRGVEGTRIRVGPTRFRDHYLRRLALAGSPRFDAERLSDGARRQLIESVHLLSSFVAVVADGSIILGVKPGREDRGAFLSFPGSGYLDRAHDVQDGDMVSTRSVVDREVREELAVTTDDNRVRCLGVFEDTDPVSHLNPALISIVSVDESPASLQARAQQALDFDEFSELVTAPLTKACLDELIELAVDESASSVPESVPVERFDGMSHKSLLLLLLLGRCGVGEDWFDRTLASYPEISVESV